MSSDKVDKIFSRQMKAIVFLELRSRKIVLFSGQIMSADKYPSLVKSN